VRHRDSRRNLARVIAHANESERRVSKVRGGNGLRKLCANCSNSKRRMRTDHFHRNEDIARKIESKLKGRNSIKPRFWLIKRRDIFIQIYIYIYVYINIKILDTNTRMTLIKIQDVKLTALPLRVSTLLTNFIEFYSDFQCPHK
jgi:hypothetical protein